MDEDFRRRLLYGLISLALSLAAAWLATQLTNRILGNPEAQKKLES